jgi:hypothetical protein
MTGLKILITSFMLSERTGLEMYVYDLAVGLQQLGHKPVIYSPLPGKLAEKLRARTIPVVDDLSSISIVPDIIHGHHHLETMTALLHFPGVPAVYFCHDWFSGLDSPPKFPRLLRFAAVDQTCYEKLILEHAIPEHRVRLMLNFVDGERFKSRGSLPERPQKALVYSSYANDGPYLTAVRDACARAGLQVDVAGHRIGNATAEPEKLLAQYDIVFAKARSAAEALTVGTAVIIYCQRSVGPMVTSGELERLLPLNFGMRSMRHHSSPTDLADDVLKEIARYDAQDASEVSRRVRKTLGSDKYIDEIISLYGEAITENRSAPAPGALEEARAASAYIHWLSPRVKEQFSVKVESPPLDLPEGQDVEAEPSVAAASPGPGLLRRAISNPTVVKLKRRFVKVPLIGKLAHSLALRLIRPDY